MNFDNEINEILAAQSYYPSECEVPEVLVLGGVPKVPKGKLIVATKLIVGKGGERIWIVATKLPKMRGKKKLW